MQERQLEHSRPSSSERSGDAGERPRDLTVEVQHRPSASGRSDDAEVLLLEQAERQRGDGAGDLTAEQGLRSRASHLSKQTWR